MEEESCKYCHQELTKEDWQSGWEGDEHHYKIINCSCGKDNWIKVDFSGSGDDSFVQGVSPLESAVRKVCEK